MRPNRFVILAAARTGSNLLVRSLNQPPRVRCFGEVAKPSYPQDRWAIDLLSKVTNCTPEALTSLHERSLSDFVFRVLYDLPGAQCGGFKFFYEHRQYPAAERLWQQLAEDPTIRVVHLTRGNLLDMFLSLVYARRTDVWVAPRQDGGEDAGNDNEDVTLDALDCQEFFDGYARDREHARRDFVEHPFLEVTYEELSNNPHEVVNSVRRFVGVPELQDYTPPLSKQAKRAAADKITNFRQLAAHFERGKWGYLFK